MWAQNAWSQIMHVDVCFFKRERAGARGRGLDFRGKSLEHAMHPQGGGGFKGFDLAAGPFALWKLDDFMNRYLRRTEETFLEGRGVKKLDCKAFVVENL